MTIPKSSPSSEITTEKTEHLKGIALLILMSHHLFGCEFLEGWRAIIPGTEGFDYIIGASGKICVAMFLFCSGYGIYKSYLSRETPKKHYILQRLIKTLIPYWIVMVIAIVYLLCVGRFEPKHLVFNLFALIHDDDMLYVSFSWFIKLYVLLILLLPLVRLIERKWKKNALIDILIYVVMPYAIAYICRSYINDKTFENIISFVVSSTIFMLGWFPLFAVGILFAKYNTYKNVRAFADKFPSALVITLSVLLIGNMFYLRFFFNRFAGNSIVSHFCMGDIVFEPIFICGFLLIMDSMKTKSRYVLPFIGKNSLFYWLLSGMFFLNTSELSFIITWPKITLLMYLWTMVLLTPFVFLTSFASDKITKLLCKRL